VQKGKALRRMGTTTTPGSILPNVLQANAAFAFNSPVLGCNCVNRGPNGSIVDSVAEGVPAAPAERLFQSGKIVKHILEGRRGGTSDEQKHETISAIELEW